MSLLYKLVHLQNKEDQKDFGDDRLFPPNFKELTEEEWAQSSFFTYTPEYKEYRQLHQSEETKAIFEKFFPDKRCVDVSIFWMHDNKGYCMVRDYWAGKVRYFSCAICEHTFSSKNIGRCLNEHTCTKCGYMETIDSSD